MSFWTHRNDKPDVERSLLGLENVEDVGGVPGKLVEGDLDLLRGVLHRNVHTGHHPATFLLPTFGSDENPSPPPRAPPQSLRALYWDPASSLIDLPQPPPRDLPEKTGRGDCRKEKERDESPATQPLDGHRQSENQQRGGAYTSEARRLTIRPDPTRLT